MRALLLGVLPALLLVTALAVTSPALSADAPAAPVPVVASADTPADRVLATTPVPDASRKVGDTRLLARGDAVVVQTLLSTKLLARVVAEIRGKEEKNWPDGQPGAEGRPAYLAALASARDRLEKRVPAGPGWTDRRQRLLIEFAADASRATVTLGTFDTSPGPDEPGPEDREVFTTMEAPREYVLRNMRLILADSFHMDEKDVDRLGPLGPASASVLSKQAPPKETQPKETQH